MAAAGRCGWHGGGGGFMAAAALAVGTAAAALRWAGGWRAADITAEHRSN